MWTYHDGDGVWLDGARSYRLRLPPGIPIANFWSVVVYDVWTRSMLANGREAPSLNSFAELVTDDDGSITITFGPDEPASGVSNWIRTIPGKGGFTILRLYDPTEHQFDHTWKPGDITPARAPQRSAPSQLLPGVRRLDSPARRGAMDGYRHCVLRMSKLFLRTLREDPTDAEVPSHRLLVRAGYIRRAAPGGFSWLPLGWIVYRNVEQIIREEMDAAGFQEVHFPALLPKEPYEATNRYAEYGENLFRLQDRHGNDFLLAPTHEEMFTLVVKDLVASYKDLPLSIYQIQTKYRDEARPRAGLLRGREFVMKDSYSFDIDDDAFMDSYRAHRDAYIKTFERLGLPVVIVSAMSGAMGGSASEEFLAPSEVGEDAYVRCTACDYAANVEAVRVPVPEPVPFDDSRPAQVVDTPDTPTIQTLVDHLNAHAEFARQEGDWTAVDTMKNVIVKLRHPDGSIEPVAIGVPGDREVDLKRLAAQVEPAQIEAFDEADFAANATLVKGYIGPGALGSSGSSGIRFLVDPRIVDGTRWVTGANESGKHVIDLTFGRDFTADGVIEAAEVVAGDACPVCGSDLEIARGIEMGHIFQLGRKYSEALGLQVQNEVGELITPTMGSYGIGVSRAVAALAEANHDDIGLIWPREVAPADVHLVIAGKEGGPQRPVAERLAAEMEATGLRVLFDDREGVSPGVRFKDAELIGVPTIVVCGRGIADDPSESLVEVKDRRSGERRDVPIGNVVAELTALG